MTVTSEFAEKFAREWVAAWNAHDLPRVLAHYTDDFEMSSPYIQELMQEPSGRLKGKERVAAYWRRALDLRPDLKFELLHALAGVSSVVVFYRWHTGRKVAEVLFFDDQGLIHRAAAHYCAE
jgi:ketosteroid isomerase-like protein